MSQSITIQHVNILHVLECARCAEVKKYNCRAQRQSYPPIDPTTGHMQTVGVPPMKVEWLLPADVLIPEGIAPIVGWWDERKKEGGDHESGGEWNDEGINEITLVDACLVLRTSYG